jgi:hypothetical protein
VKRKVKKKKKKQRKKKKKESQLKEMEMSNHIKQYQTNESYSTCILMNKFKKYFTENNLIKLTLKENLQQFEQFEIYLKNSTSLKTTSRLSEKESDSLTYQPKFEFIFIKLLKLIFLNYKELIESKFQLNLLMFYCLNKSLQQFDLFKLSFQATTTKSGSADSSNTEFDNQDEYNLNEL